jgi:hypothetical protein
VDLSQKSHRNVVMLLAAINDEESYNSKTSAGRGDTSQTGFVAALALHTSWIRPGLWKIGIKPLILLA